VPLCDDLWLVAHDKLATVNASVFRGLVQSPLEQRNAARVAMLLASRPETFAMEVEAAAAFATRMFS